MFWTTRRDWQGETVFILACGPSLGGFDASRLRRQRVITINDSYELAPWADILYFCDARWWVSRRQKVLRKFTGSRIVTLNNPDISEALSLRNSGESGLETAPDGLRHGLNSGYQAIGLAYHMGAARIVLLGYDMRVGQHRIHWNARPELQNVADYRNSIRNWLPLFKTLKQPLADAGIEVLNCTPGSALKTWPLVSLDVTLSR